MKSIEMINDNNYDKITSFLSSVPSINSIEDDVVLNTVAIIDDDKVLGSVSFEIYDSNALIRYFVFKRNIDNTYINNMIEKLCALARNKNISNIVCIADSKVVYDLFLEFGFVEIEDNIFINEDKKSNSNYSNAEFLIKSIVA